MFLLPASCRGQAEDTALAGMLLRPEALWRRLELRLLEGAVVELPPCFEEDAGAFGLLPPRRAQLDLLVFVQASTDPLCPGISSCCCFRLALVMGVASKGS